MTGIGGRAGSAHLARVGKTGRYGRYFCTGAGSVCDSRATSSISTTLGTAKLRATALSSEVACSADNAGAMFRTLAVGSNSGGGERVVVPGSSFTVWVGGGARGLVSSSSFGTNARHARGVSALSTMSDTSPAAGGTTTASDPGAVAPVKASGSKKKDKSKSGGGGGKKKGGAVPAADTPVAELRTVSPRVLSVCSFC